MINPADFMTQIKNELQRVTWPTQKEAVGMTIAVIIMVICVMVYFFLTDSVIYFCIRKILDI